MPLAWRNTAFPKETEGGYPQQKYRVQSHPSVIVSQCRLFLGKGGFFKLRRFRRWNRGLILKQYQYGRAEKQNWKPPSAWTMAVQNRKHKLSGGEFCPLEGTAFAGANCRGESVSLAVLPPFLCAVKEMGVNTREISPSFPAEMPPPTIWGPKRIPRYGNNFWT